MARRIADQSPGTPPDASHKSVLGHELDSQQLERCILTDPENTSALVLLAVGQWQFTKDSADALRFSIEANRRPL